MSWLTAITGFFSGRTGEKIVEAADNAVYTQQEKARDDTDYTVRALNDGAVDIVNRWIRPGMTLWLIGGMSGWWELPNTGSIDPVWFQIFLIVVTFWFGGRVLLKDLPAAVNAILQMKR